MLYPRRIAGALYGRTPFGPPVARYAWANRWSSPDPFAATIDVASLVTCSPRFCRYPVLEVLGNRGSRRNSLPTDQTASGPRTGASTRSTSRGRAGRGRRSSDTDAACCNRAECDGLHVRFRCPLGPSESRVTAKTRNPANEGGYPCRESRARPARPRDQSAPLSLLDVAISDADQIQNSVEAHRRD
jgi:hypothetical protein